MDTRDQQAPEARESRQRSPRHDDQEFGEPERRWAGEDTRTIHVRLTSQEHWELRRRASAAGLRPWDLARHWLVAQLDRPEASVDDEDLSYEMHSASRLPYEQRGTIEHLLRRLDRLERMLGSAPLGSYGQLGPRPPASPMFGDPLAASSTPHPKLHEEILAVLHENGGPLTSEAIADAVTRRGRYRARSGHALSAAAISGRIANPRYRGLFRRDGRLIMPAVPDSMASYR